ncbi:gamma-aminobutyric acid receptor subunit beta-like [Oppia nitens]|uniref:gamma-aminobutyric acid receptor subunit beta-like n=1 Tax=Oppia nitens TaxID=1686743 RepID=UPI0023DC1AE8|nr:gamma-aminobutyric acid receptor subunit beta-like [Oppia nitens]
MYFRQKWSDPRLQHSYPSVKVVGSQSFIDRVWIPDTFLPNADSITTVSIPTPTSFAMIESNGTVLGLDVYGYSMKDVDFEWAKGDQSAGITTDIETIGGYKFSGKSIDKKVEKLSSVMANTKKETPIKKNLDRRKALQLLLFLMIWSIYFGSLISYVREKVSNGSPEPADLKF